jgi:lysophospholipase L1-like esterase
VLFFSLEISCRLHHYFAYGLFHPILGHIVHYSPEGFNLLRKEAGNWKPDFEQTTTGDYNAILSGASTAFGFGVEKHQNLLSGLNKKLDGQFKFINTAFPAIRLYEELERLQKRRLKQVKLIIFFSGFNDCYLSDPHFTAQLRHAKFFAYLPILNRSLLLHKIIARSRLLDFRAKNENFSLTIKQIQKKIQILSRQYPDARIIFFMQPHLDQKKTKTKNEQNTYEQYKKFLGTVFQEKRIALSKTLSGMPELKFIDMLPLFENDNNELFIDPCHLNADGTAKALNEIIQTIYKLPIIYDEQS